jgi:hypothetical protein
LHRAFVAPRHDGVEIGRIRPFQFNRGDDGFPLGAEATECGVGGAAASPLLVVDRPVGTVAERPVAENLDEKALDKRAAQLGFFLLAEGLVTDGLRPVVQQLLVVGRSGLSSGALGDEARVKQRLMRSRHGIRQRHPMPYRLIGL